MTRSNEELISRRPLLVRRRVKWGECDPAEVVYTPQFSHYVVIAMEFFFEEVLGRHNYGPSSREGIGFPLKALAFEFFHFLTANDELWMTVRVLEIRKRSFDLEVRATLGDELAFIAKVSPICLDNATKQAIDLPADMRGALTEHLAIGTEDTREPSIRNERQK